jgi:chromosome segregation ATPase
VDCGWRWKQKVARAGIGIKTRWQGRRDFKNSKRDEDANSNSPTLNTLRDALSQANDKNRSLEAKSSEQDERLSELGREIESKTSAASNLEMDISALRSKLVATEAELQSKTEALASLESEVKDSP